MVTAEFERGHKRASCGEETVDVLVVFEVAEWMAECDVCDDIHGEILGDQGHIKGSVGGGEFADEGDHIIDSVVDVGFEVGKFFASVLSMLELRRYRHGG